MNLSDISPDILTKATEIATDYHMNRTERELVLVVAKAIAEERRSSALDTLGKIDGEILAAEASQSNQWQPIETAPKDGTRIALFQGGKFTTGQWSEDEYTKKPRPYWATDRGQILGKTFDRSCQPTHWMPLPEPPKGGAE